MDSHYITLDGEETAKAKQQPAITHQPEYRKYLYRRHVAPLKKPALILTFFLVILFMIAEHIEPIDSAINKQFLDIESVKPYTRNIFRILMTTGTFCTGLLIVNCFRHPRKVLGVDDIHIDVDLRWSDEDSVFSENRSTGGDFNSTA